MLFFSPKCNTVWNHSNTMKANMHFSRLNLRASQDKMAHIVRETVIGVTAKLLWQHFDFKDGQLMNAQWQNTVKRGNFLCEKKCLKQSRFMFFSGRVFDKSCQDCSTYTPLTAAYITKSKPPPPEFKRSSLFVSASFSLVFFLACYFPFLVFPPAWVSHSAQSCSWPQIRSVYIVSPLPVEIHTSDIFSIQYPQAMFRCLINQITVT